MDLAACHVSPARKVWLSLRTGGVRRTVVLGGWVCLRVDDGIKRINTWGECFIGNAPTLGKSWVG